MLVLTLAACTPDDPVVPDPTVPTEPVAYPDNGVTAFVGVTVLTMRPEEPVLADRTVVVHRKKIIDITSADAVLPDTATVIDGEGRFLMPGLIDAHVHVWYEGELTLLVANGVTATRNLFGDPLQRRWRDAIVDGDRFGPTLVTAGPIVDGTPPLWATSDIVVTAEDAAAVVGDQVAYGYDLVKVYNNLGRPAWEAVLAEAGERGATVGGHVPWAVGWDDVVASDQHTIEHLDGLVDLVGAAPAPIFLYDDAAMNAALDNADQGRLEAAAERAAADGVVLVPTLVVIDRFGSPAENAAWAAEPVMQYVHPDIAWSWSTNPPLAEATLAALDRYALALGDFTVAFQRAGATIALGTDANNAYVIPGFSVHDELRLLVAAGLTVEEALAAGTVNAAAAIGRADLGTVAIDQRADLLLLDADPTVDVANAEARAGVMVGGDWYPEDDLQGRLADLAASYASARSAARQPPLFDGCHHP